MKKFFYFEKPGRFQNPFSLRIYHFCPIGFAKPFFYRSEKFFTKVIYLEEDISKIVNNFKANTRNEIKKVEKFGLDFSDEIDQTNLVRIYNDRARILKRPLLATETVATNLIVTGMSLDQKICSIHAYVSKPDHTVSLLYSVLNYDSGVEPKVLGMANRKHHLMDIQKFKESKYKIYDFGGYALSTENSKLKAINKFKDSFGGTLLEYQNFESPMICFYRKLLILKEYIENSIRNK